MSTAMWKLEKDLCRCCHAEGSFKHLSDPCFQLGQEEIYSDMLQDCLDIKIVPMTGVLSDVTYTICESCVVRLRDAANFKQQVQDCEERFKEMYSKNLIRGLAVKDEPMNESDDLKQEFQSIDEDDDDAFMNFDDDGDDSLDDQPLSVEVKPKIKGKAKAKPKPKAKKTPAKKTTKGKPIKLETEDITEAAVSGEKKKGSLLEEELRCLPYVSSVEEVGSKKYFCTLCDTRLSSVYSMKRHIASRHTDVKCPICAEQFTTTQKKNEHLLKTHNVEVENDKKLKESCKCICDICKKQYTNKLGLQIHIANMHTLRQCPDCPSMFTDRDLSIHRNDVHKTPIPTCGICGYRNKKPSLVLLHQRQVHLRERTVPCEFCNLTFFNVKFLKRHLIRHKPERIHECEFCHKKFPRKTTLRMHEKIHKGEKNKVCELCGARFVQKASLNYHMVKHHPDAC